MNKDLQNIILRYIDPNLTLLYLKELQNFKRCTEGNFNIHLNLNDIDRIHKADRFCDCGCGYCIKCNDQWDRIYKCMYCKKSACYNCDYKPNKLTNEYIVDTLNSCSKCRFLFMG